MAKYATDFTAATTLNSSDLFQVVQSGADKKGTMGLILSYVGANSTAFPTVSTFNTFQSSMNAHAPTHLLGSTNELDVAKTRVSNVTLTTGVSAGWTSGGNAAHLGAYLYALDTRINNNQLLFSTHNAQHTEGAADEIEGLALDGTGFSPVNYTLATWGGGTTTTSIGAHFSGIDTALDTITDGIALKAPLASPTFTGTVLIPDLAVSDDTSKAANTKFVHDAVDALVDGATVGYQTLGDIQSSITVSLTGKANTDHNATHETGGSDALDGTKTFAGYTAVNYTPAVYRSGGTTTEVGSHFKGIDDYFAATPTMIQAIAPTQTVTIATIDDAVNVAFNTTEISNSITNNTTYQTIEVSGHYYCQYNLTVVPESITDLYVVRLKVNGAAVGAVAHVVGLKQNVSGSLIGNFVASDDIYLTIFNNTDTNDIDVIAGSISIFKI